MKNHSKSKEHVGRIFFFLQKKISRASCTEIKFINVECLRIAFLFFTLWEKLIEPFLAESQKKKQQDDSDEYDDDDSAASTSFQPQPIQPQQGYIPPMAQPGLPPVPGAPGMPPGST